MKNYFYPMSYYQEISKYYDMLMEAGYYDYGALATTLQSVIGERQSVLELGIGTGQVAQLLVEANPSYDFAGMDFSAAMLELAQKRLPSEVKLIECDIAEMDLGRQYDVGL